VGEQGKVPHVLDCLDASHLILVEVQEVLQLFENVLDPPPADVKRGDAERKWSSC